MVAAYGLAGGPGFQVLAPVEDAASVHTRLLELGAEAGLVEACAEAFEILRIEAGVPWLGHDLDESVLPDEAGLDHAVSTTKGCYTGQEVVARMRSRGRISHRLVGLRGEAAEPLSVGADVLADGRRIGEVTSATVSPIAGPIALAYLRVPHDAVGTDVEVEGIGAQVERKAGGDRQRRRLDDSAGQDRGQHRGDQGQLGRGGEKGPGLA